MNAPTPDHADLREQRLARELRAAAREIDLTPGSELAVVTRGRRRRQRHRRATTFTLVTALAAGTAVGVQQLSRNGDDSIASDQADETVPTASTVATDPGTTAAPLPTAVPTPMVAPVSPEIPDDVPPAQLVESNMVWTVVEPNSTQAVGWVLNNSGGAVVSRVPALVLSTAPGRSDDFEPSLWRTEDGITWSIVDLGVPVGNPGSVVIDGSSLYNVGTAPGIAADEPNPLLVAVSSDEGATWQQVPLPVDTNDGRDLPFVNGVNVYGSPLPIDGGVLVLVSRNLALDWEELARVDERLANGFQEIRPDGLLVPTDPSCLPTATTIQFGSEPSGRLVPLDAEATAEPTCFDETELLTWDELGVADETARALATATTLAYVVRGSEVTEVPVPQGLGYVGEFDGSLQLTDVDGNWYQLKDDGNIVPTDPPSGVGGNGWSIGSVDEVGFEMVQRYSSFATVQDYVVATAPEGQIWSDWTALYGDDVVPYRSAIGTTPTGLVSVVQAQIQEGPRDGAWSVVGGGLTIRRGSMRVDPTFELTDSGEVLPLDRVRIDTENGDLVAIDEDGTEVARMLRETANPILYGAGADGTPPPSEWYVETSIDGRNVAVERIAPLLGVDDADIASVPRISTDGTRTIVAVTLTERNTDGVPRQLVLVGTPKA